MPNLSFAILDFAILVGGFLLSALLVPAAIRLAVHRGFVDQPGGRKDHARPVPPVGGLVFVPLFLLLAPFLGLSPFDHWPLYLALLVIVGAGALDDYKDLPATLKLFIQLGVAALLAGSGEAVLGSLGHLFGGPNDVLLGMVAIPFTVVCFVFLINAMNMIDGVDGLSGSLSFVMLGCLAVAATLSGDLAAARWAILLMFLLLGFLLHNARYPGHPRARVFMGDAGSMALGVLIAWLAIHVAGQPETRLVPMGVGWVILIPIVDAFALFICRIRAGRRAFTPGRDHFHHQLLSAGFRPGQVAMGMAVLGLIFGGIGVLGPRFGFGEGPLTFGWLFILLGYTVFLVRRRKALYGDDPSFTST